MGRNSKPGISFYRMDSGHILNKKVRMLCNEYDSDGYYIWSSLIDYAYFKWGYYFDLNNKEDLEWFATEYCKKKITLIREVIAGCIRRGLFEKTVADSFGILTSDMMQEVFVYATAERRKKGSVFQMHENWLKIDFGSDIPVNIQIVPGNNQNTSREESTDKTETKTETKKDKTKQKLSAPAPPTPPKKVKENPEDTEPYWQSLVKVWFEFGLKKFKVAPSFDRDDPKIFKRVVHRLKKRAEQKNQTWDEPGAVMRVQKFLEAAFTDDWLAKNFLLSNLEKQFDKVIQGQNNLKKVPVSPKPVLTKIQREVNYLFARFLEGDQSIVNIATDHWHVLRESGMVTWNGIVTAELEKQVGELINQEQMADTPQLRSNLSMKFGVLKVFGLQPAGKTDIFS